MNQESETLPPLVDHEVLPDVAANLAERYFPDLDRLREENPVVRIRKRETEIYTFLRSDAVKEIFRNPELFGSGGGGDVYRSSTSSRSRPVTHTAWRLLIQGFLSPKMVRDLEPRMRELARDLIDRVADRGACDFVGDFAKPYPVSIFFGLMGLPQEDMRELADWEAKVWTPPEQDPSGADNKAGMEFLQNYILRMIDERRRKPDDSLFTKLINSEIDGQLMSDQELLARIMVLCLGGFHTTKAALSRMLLHLARNAEHQRLVREDPSVFPTFIEEIMRAYSLGETFRTVTEDTVLDGCPLKRGAVVSAHMPAANRDPRAYENPERIDPRRKPNQHVAFGFGPHTCLGIHLARMDMRVALEEWHKRIPEYRIPEGVEVVEQIYAGVGPCAIPLVWDVRR